jgi:hypothetical protein
MTNICVRAPLSRPAYYVTSKFLRHKRLISWRLSLFGKRAGGPRPARERSGRGRGRMGGHPGATRSHWGLCEPRTPVEILLGQPKMGKSWFVCFQYRAERSDFTPLPPHPTRAGMLRDSRKPRQIPAGIQAPGPHSPTGGCGNLRHEAGQGAKRS